MKRLLIVSVMIALFGFSLSIAQVASADPIPPSAGCQAFVGYRSTQGIGDVLITENFWEEDIIHIISNHPINFRATNSLGLAFNNNGVTTINFVAPRTAQYVFSVLPLGGIHTDMVVSCTPTPLSGGCIDSDLPLGPGGISLTFPFDAGEHLIVNSSGALKVHITGPVFAYFPAVANLNFIFPVSGVYNVSMTADAHPGVTGWIRCARPL